MEVLYLLIPVSVVLVTAGVLIFRWAVRSGQYDDLDTEAHSILFDDDKPDTTSGKGHSGQHD